MKKKLTAIDELKKNGITIIKKVIGNKECLKLKKNFIFLSNKRAKEGEKIFVNDGSIRVNNFFLENYKLTKYLFNFKLNKILNNLLGDPYVLRVGTAMNLQDTKGNRAKDGTGWHTDWGFNSENIKFGYGGSYHTILALDDFKSNNGATHYIKGSHRWKLKPKKDEKYKSSKIIMKKGSMAIFDSAIWHRSGVPSKYSRWGIWNVYTQWWVKPYFRYHDMFDRKIRKKLDKNICKILHLNSIPPLNGKKRVLTVTELD